MKNMSEKEQLSKTMENVNMTIDELNNFIKVINNYNDIEYFFSTILFSASPTLARQKAASLLNFSNNNRNLQNNWEIYKGYIKSNLNISIFELKEDEQNTIVLFYNEEILKGIIKEKRNYNLLKKFGYSKNMSIEEQLSVLSMRFKNTCPHEIGIFLGYPVDDVAAFIKYPKEKCKTVGYWKVYHDEEKAKRIFLKYDKIKRNVINMLIKGSNPIEVFDMFLCNSNLNFQYFITHEF